MQLTYISFRILNFVCSGWFEVAVLNSDGTAIAQNRWRRKGILTIAPGEKPSAAPTYVAELLQQYREKGIIQIPQKKKKKKQLRHVDSMHSDQIDEARFLQNTKHVLKSP